MCYIIIHIFCATYNSFEKINAARGKKQKTQTPAQKDWKMEGDVRWHGSIYTEMIIFLIVLNPRKVQFQPAETLEKGHKNEHKSLYFRGLNTKL